MNNAIRTPTGKQALAGTVGAAAAALVLAVVSQWEGKRNDPYADLVGKMTVCFGETNVPMRRYSNGECEDMLGGSLNTYAKAVLARNPELAGHPYQLAAAVSLSYNIGISAYNRSTVARRFSAGDWLRACDAFLAWNRAGGRVVKGLDNRRRHEREICRTGL